MHEVIHAAPPFSTSGFISAASKLSPAESKLLSSTKAEIDRLNDLAGQWRKPRMGQEHPIDMEIHLQSVELSENPTSQNAEKLHALVMKKRDCELSEASIAQALTAPIRREIDKLAPIAIRILDDAEKAFLAESTAHKAETRTQTTFSSVAADHDARVESTKQALAEKRRWITEENAAAHFLFIELGLGIS
jgi:hypothetical protein